MVKESRSPTSGETSKPDRRVGTSPVGRADSGTGGHLTRHVGKSIIPRGSPTLHDGGPPGGFGVIPPKVER